MSRQVWLLCSIFLFKHILPHTLTGSSLSPNTFNIKRFSDRCGLSLRSHPTQHCKRPRSLHTVRAHTVPVTRLCWILGTLTGLLRSPAAVSVITTRRRTDSENFFSSSFQFVGGGQGKTLTSYPSLGSVLNIFFF